MNAQQAWQAVIGQLQMGMPKTHFDTWVRNTELISHSDSKFTVGVQNAYARDWLESRLSNTVVNLLSGLLEQPQSVDFVVWHKDVDNYHEEEHISLSTTSSDLPVNSTVNQRYTFDNFVVGASNRLAQAACLAVAENPARAYNPLFLYSGVGLGKTHLLHAIGNLSHSNGLNVMYVSSEEFTNDFISSVRSHTPVAFRERYRQTDMLMIDDIQFIIGKEGTQEEFFHTFNTLHGQNKQIIITSDRPPKAMVTLEERMRSRFEWGLIADIQPPDIETRIAILRSKADKTDREVPNEILEIIARQIQSNIRELEGALTRVLAYSHLINQPLTPQLVNTALADLMSRPEKIEPVQVIDAVANAFCVSIERMVGRDRSRDVALPRQVAMYILREDMNVSLPRIGQSLGGRDHSTVMHGCEKVAEMIETDDQLRRQIFQIREQLYGSTSVIV